MKSLIDNRPGPRGPRSTVTCRLKGGVGSCHAKGETAGATVRTTADVAVARISKKDNRASPDHGNPGTETFRGQGPGLSTVASMLPLACPPKVATGRRFGGSWYGSAPLGAVLYHDL
ncbi:hypothetical protein Psuf_023000 [Phytohabitans suffuscus]|uniref:Uncharacterized protein n=1 Tax=Phytohabitans suffuscus TaxID=624315 RepID=A0A6F8YFZ0_9ACTN|nr:hypothetical protein Psuf_023000 [Phytohabitans suffuscus]